MWRYKGMEFKDKATEVKLKLIKYSGHRDSMNVCEKLFKRFVVWPATSWELLRLYVRPSYSKRNNDRKGLTIYEFIGKIAQNNNGNEKQKQTRMSNTRAIEKIASELNQCLTRELEYGSE